MQHFIKKSGMALLAILGMALLLNGCSQQETPGGKPNVVLIFADDMGYGDLECYGHPTIKTPNLNQMADEGIRFTSFYAAASVCTPSRAGLLTGRYPVRNAPHNFGPGSKDGLPLDEITVANLLKDQGYQTMAVGKWHLGHRPEYLPTARGFDGFYGLPYSNDMILPWCPWLDEKDDLYLYEDAEPVKLVNFDQDSLTVNYTQKALEFIRTAKEGPFFLYLAHSMPHLPIATTEKFRGTSAAGLYGDVIETMDWSTGQILKTLREEGIDKNTLVIFTSDNGPWHNLPDRMLQRGNERWHAGSTSLLNGAKGSSYEGGFRVPGIVRWPGQIPGGQTSHEIASTVDLFATIVELSGGQVPKDRDIDGTNIMPLFKGEKAAGDKTFFYSKGKRVEAVREGEWKLRVTNSNTELFNLNLDPAEMYNRADEKPELVQKLYAKMEDLASRSGAEIAPLKE